MQPSEPPPPYTPTLTQFRYSQDQDSIRTFQENQFGEGDEQWDRLVPEEARASLSEREVNRQGAIFEIIKSEKEYVADLETLQVVSSTLSRVHRPWVSLDVIDRSSSLRSSTPACRLSISKKMKYFPISTGSWRTNVGFLLRCTSDSGSSTP